MIQLRPSYFLLLALSLLAYAKANYCKKLLGELGNAESNFSYCVTMNSVPVAICVGCKEQYESVQQKFANIRNPNNNCSSMYFDNDRVNLVTATKDSLTNLWTKAYCDDCFKNNNIEEFTKMNAEFEGCVNQNPKFACEKCVNQYKALNNFYKQLDQHNNGNVCYDIQDSMNRTRNNWSKEHNCCRRESNMTLFTAALSIFSAILVLFYSGTYIVTRRREGNHGVLNDEEPLLSSSEATTSAAAMTSNSVRAPNETPTVLARCESPAATWRHEIPVSEIRNTNASVTSNANALKAPPFLSYDKQSKGLEGSDESSDDENLAYKKY
uniref:Putative osteopetrosis-associated transmembrane protein 1 n=1 Tax=Haematobia irritans TaxID=7368 RepID=A0A1L8EJ12_HAEIR